MTKTELLFLQQSNAIESEYDAQSLLDALEAWSYIRRHRTLNLWNIRNTHYLLMKNRTTLDKGEIGAFRIAPVWIGGREGMHWSMIKDALEGWCVRANLLIKTKKSLDITEGIIKNAHIEYEKIHPFIDGNGRTGRIFYNWQRLRLGLPIHVIHEGKEQMEYYKWFS